MVDDNNFLSISPHPCALFITFGLWFLESLKENIKKIEIKNRMNENLK